MKMHRYRDFISRIRGISFPICGVSWQPPGSERQVIRRLLVFLEARRSLRLSHSRGVRHYVTPSILEIRQTLETALKDIENPESPAIPPLRAMREECESFLDVEEAAAAQDLEGGRGKKTGLQDILGEEHDSHQDVNQALLRVRETFATNIALLCTEYGLDIQGPLGDLVDHYLPEAEG